MKITTNTTRTIKTANSCLVLDVIRNSPACTVEEIIDSTHLSRPTVLNIISELLGRNVIKRAGFVETTIGRQPVLYAIDTETHFAIGIDFEFPPVHLVVTDLSGTPRYHKNWNCSFDTDKEDIIEMLVSGIREAIDVLSLKQENIIGIGLGIPGTVDLKKNVSRTITRIPEWNMAPLSELLAEQFHVPIYVRNDVHLMAMAAQASLPLPQDFMYIAYRIGIGMAILRNGKLAEGPYGNAGFIGHMTVDINGDLCICGMRGCLETFSSKPAIESKYAQVKHLSQKMSFDMILSAAANGDPIAVNILETAGKYLGVALANCVKLHDISTIVLDDLPCSPDHVFIRSIEDTANYYCRDYTIEPIRIIPHTLAENDYALGAALFVLDTFFQKPKLTLTV